MVPEQPQVLQLLQLLQLFLGVLPPDMKIVKQRSQEESLCDKMQYMMNLCVFVTDINLMRIKLMGITSQTC